MRYVRLAVLCAMVALGGALSLAQDALPVEPDEPSTDEPAEPAPAEPAPAEPVEPPKEEEDKPFYLGIFASVSWGSFTSNPFETDIETTALLNADTAVEMEDMRNARVGLGWRFPEEKGDIRLFFSGYDEDEYSYRSRGIFKPVGLPEVLAKTVTISGGRLVTTNNLNPAGSFQENVADSLQNQVQTLDAMYGREFGGRRFHSHWWGGLRYFNYEGNMLSGAWLHLDDAAQAAGEGFTDSGFLPLINSKQKASGFGPTGAWEVDFSFFDRGLTLFLRGQAAFVISDIETDTGVFNVPVTTEDANQVSTLLMLEVQLDEKRDKTSWQNTGELGARLSMKNGLLFELAYSITGFLDIVITPTQVTLPDRQQALGALCDDPRTCVAANYISRDFDVEGWYATVGFQF